MAAQWPHIRARLVVLLPTLPGWNGIKVYPGRVPTGSPPVKYATVGWTSADESGSYNSTQDPNGFQWQEAGIVHGEIVCSSGSKDQSITEAQIQAALDGLDAAVRADRRLGVLSPAGTSSFTVTLAPVLNNQGSAYLARFFLDYLTVT